MQKTPVPNRYGQNIKITFSLFSKSSIIQLYNCLIRFQLFDLQIGIIECILDQHPGIPSGKPYHRLIWHSISTGAFNAMASSRTGFKSSCLVTR